MGRLRSGEGVCTAQPGGVPIPATDPVWPVPRVQSTVDSNLGCMNSRGAGQPGSQCRDPGLRVSQISGQLSGKGPGESTKGERQGGYLRGGWQLRPELSRQCGNLPPPARNGAERECRVLKATPYRLSTAAPCQARLPSAHKDTLSLGKGRARPGLFNVAGATLGVHRARMRLDPAGIPAPATFLLSSGKEG